MSNIISLALLEITILCTQQLIKESSLAVAICLVVLLGLGAILYYVIRKDKWLR